MAASQKFLWTCELNKDKPSIKWSPSDLVELEDDEDTDFLINSLILKTAVLGSKAVDGERNLVAIRTRNHADEEFEQPIFSLTLGKQDMVCGIDLTLTYDRNQECEFKLIEGNGPVFITCTHLLEMPSNDEQQTFMTTSDVSCEEGEEVGAEENTEMETNGTRAAKLKAKMKNGNHAAENGKEIECGEEKPTKRKRN